MSEGHTVRGGAYNAATKRFREPHIPHSIQRTAVHPSSPPERVQFAVHQLAGYPSAPTSQTDGYISGSLSLDDPKKKRNTDLVVFPDLTNYRVESLVDVDRLLGGCLHEGASEVFCQVATL